MAEAEAEALTVAIPTMGRFSFLKESVPRMLAIPQVAHIVIVDETGEDAAAIWAEPWGLHPKLSIQINEARVGIFENKRRALAAAPTPWVLLLDSDNEWPAASFAALRLPADPTSIVAAGGMIRRDMATGQETRPLESFASIDVTRANWNAVLAMPKANELINDGNYVINRAALDLIPRNIPHERYRAADVLVWLHRLVGAGWTFKVDARLEYIHNVHAGSSWLAEAGASWAVMKEGWGL
jgi:hypothetical protein